MKEFTNKLIIFSSELTGKALCVFFLLISTCLLFAESEADIAVLLRGPVPGSGIFFLPPNAIDYSYGEYKRGERNISVFYIKGPFVISSEWLKTACGSSVVFEIPDENLSLFYYNIGKEQSVFFLFPEDMEDRCGFIGRFSDRLNYFLRIYPDDPEVPFPAILVF